MREQFVGDIAEAQERLRLYDLAQTPLPHAPDCPCPLGACTLRRLDALPPLDWTEEERQAFQEAME